ncbi:hypothetical protein HWV62_17573 [Athelia sp. TMB]|nr:hypothetical protein HWV62_17573 [Athelia sp. TMB]
MTSRVVPPALRAMSRVSRQVRSSLSGSSDAPGIIELLRNVDAFVLECSTSPGQDSLLNALDDELQGIHHDLVGHDSLEEIQVFLRVLYHLRPILSSTSIIGTWFDLVLRPALREPKLPTEAVNNAKELIICALEGSVNSEKVSEFRRRLLDLYLLDAMNEGSGADVLEWAELDQEQRDKKTLWKGNLEDLLVKYGLQRPTDLLTGVAICFATPSSRLQLFMFLNVYTSQRSFQALSSALAAHPVMALLLRSLLLDNSSTVCTTGLTVVVKLLSIFAVHASTELKALLPQLYAVLLRMINWKERPLSDLHSTTSAADLEEIPAEAEIVLDQEIQNERALHIRSDLGWERLELTFDSTASSAPSPRALFTILYYLFPRTTLRFLREPTVCLAEQRFETPYTISWEEALDNEKIRSQSESLTRTHLLHPLIIWRDTSSELSQPDFWAVYGVSQVASESMMLDLRHAAFAMRARHPELAPDSKQDDELQSLLVPENDVPLVDPPSLFSSTEDLSLNALTPHPQPVELREPAGRPRISLQYMLSASVALKSNMDIEIIQPSHSWPTGLFPTAASSPSRKSISLPPESESSSLLQADTPSHIENAQHPSHVVQAISGLQREVLLLRNELNFELWLSRENVKHIGRLFQDRILSKNAENERQGLFNKLRKYRAQVTELERELKEHKEQAFSAKNKYADWNTELQSKLREFRKEKKTWITEAASLRSAEKEAKDQFVAQGKLLSEAAKEVFDLKTQKKETQHKIDRLRDYEQQIEQHIKMQRLWDDDFQKFNARGEELDLMKSKYRQMEMRLETYEKIHAEMDDSARVYRRQIQALEARLAVANKKNGASRHMPAEEIAAFVAEKAALTNSNTQLRDENIDLREEIEEMTAMVEMLKAQVSGKKGLVSARASPIMFG